MSLEPATDPLTGIPPLRAGIRLWPVLCDPVIKLGPGWCGRRAMTSYRQRGGDVSPAGRGRQAVPGCQRREEHPGVRIACPGRVHRVDFRRGNAVYQRISPQRQDTSGRAGPARSPVPGRSDRAVGAPRPPHRSRRSGPPPRAHCNSASRTGLVRGPAPMPGSRRPAGRDPGTGARRQAALPPTVPGLAPTHPGPGHSPRCRRCRLGRWDRCPASGLAERLGTEAGDEGALGVRPRPGPRRSRCPAAGSGVRKIADALGGQRRPDQVAPRPGAVAARVQHRQALPGGGGHDVEAAAHLDVEVRRACRRRVRVAPGPASRDRRSPPRRTRAAAAAPHRRFTTQRA